MSAALQDDDDEGSTSREDSSDDDDAVVLPSTVALGIVFAGVPPRIREIEQDSPLVGTPLQAGHIIREVTVPGRLDIEGIMSSSQLRAALDRYAGVDGRVLRVTNDVQTMARRHTSFRVTLPVGRVGIRFAGTPPVITGISQDSPLEGILRRGLRVESLRIEGDSFEMVHPSSEHLGAVLSQYANREDRILTLKKKTRQSSSSSGPLHGEEPAATAALSDPSSSVWPRLPANHWANNTLSIQELWRSNSTAKRVQLLSYVIILSGLVIGTLLLVFIHGSDSGGTFFVLVITFGIAAVTTNISWSCQKPGVLVSHAQVLCTLFVSTLLGCAIAVIRCENSNDWCSALKGIIYGGGVTTLVFVNLPSCFHDTSHVVQDDGTAVSSSLDDDEEEEVVADEPSTSTTGQPVMVYQVEW